MNNLKIDGYTSVLIAASLWATLGLFYKGLVQWYGMSLIGIVFWRALVASLILFTILKLVSRRQLVIARKDVWVFLGLGSAGVAGFFAVYIYAINQIGMGIAAVLLYNTAPVWVATFSVLVLKEHMTVAKNTALILTVVGMILVGYRYYFENLSLGVVGIGAGLGSGLGYAAHILFSKAAVQRGYSPWAINAYGFGIGALILLLFQDSSEIVQVVSNWRILIWLVLLGLLPTLGGGVAFYFGLKKMPASDASILATLEPVIAAVLGWFVFSEYLEIPQIIGGMFIIVSVILIQLSNRRLEHKVSQPIQEEITGFGVDTK